MLIKDVFNTGMDFEINLLPMYNILSRPRPCPKSVAIYD